MYNIKYPSFCSMVDTLTRRETIPLYYHQKAICNLYGMEFETPSDKKNFKDFSSDQIKNSVKINWMKVRNKLDELDVDNNVLVTLQSCTEIMEHIVDISLKLKDFADGNPKDHSKCDSHHAKVVYNASYLLIGYISQYSVEALYILDNYLVVKLEQVNSICSDGLSSLATKKVDYDMVSESTQSLLSIVDEVLDQFKPTEFNKKLMSVYSYKND